MKEKEKSKALTSDRWEAIGSVIESLESLRWTDYRSLLHQLGYLNAMTYN